MWVLLVPACLFGAAFIIQATAVLFALLTRGAFHRCFSGARFEARPPSAVTVVQKTADFTLHYARAGQTVKQK